MIDFLTITNDPVLAERCDRLEGMRLFVDLERNGKAERQAGRNTFISTHEVTDIGRVKAVLRRSKLMVRVNPFQLANTAAAEAEIQEVLAQGADLIMLPMFTSAEELRGFAAVLDGRAPLVALLETRGALESLDAWVATPGLHEIFVGLNDLHLSLGCSFMFEPLAQGHVERVALAARRAGLRFGFGGIARVDEGLLPGRDVLAEHLRLGSRAVILSRTFNRPGEGKTFEDAVAELRDAEQALAARPDAQAREDSVRVHALIGQLASQARARVAA
ncbi:MAG: aldolase/citrate lyase family protein [Polaromonas sp.]|nr:aldolase/citrate lyase family protein [Polaromonas sp.]